MGRHFAANIHWLPTIYRRYWNYIHFVTRPDSRAVTTTRLDRSMDQIIAHHSNPYALPAIACGAPTTQEIDQNLMLLLIQLMQEPEADCKTAKAAASCMSVKRRILSSWLPPRANASNAMQIKCITQRPQHRKFFRKMKEFCLKNNSHFLFTQFLYFKLFWLFPLRCALRSSCNHWAVILFARSVDVHGVILVWLKPWNFEPFTCYYR